MGDDLQSQAEREAALPYEERMPRARAQADAIFEERLAAARWRARLNGAAGVGLDVLDAAESSARDAWDLARAAWNGGGEVTVVGEDGVARREVVDGATAAWLLAGAAGVTAAETAAAPVLAVYAAAQVPLGVYDAFDDERRRSEFTAGAETAWRGGGIDAEAYETLALAASEASAAGIAVVAARIAETLPALRQVGARAGTPTGRRIEGDELMRDLVGFANVERADPLYTDERGEPVTDVDAFMERYEADHARRARSGSTGSPATRRVIVQIEADVRRMFPDAIHVSGGTRRERLERGHGHQRRGDLVFVLPGDPPLILQFEIGDALASGDPSRYEQGGIIRWDRLWGEVTQVDRVLMFGSRRPRDGGSRN